MFTDSSEGKARRLSLSTNAALPPAAAAVGSNIERVRAIMAWPEADAGVSGAAARARWPGDAAAVSARARASAEAALAAAAAADATRSGFWAATADAAPVACLREAVREERTLSREGDRRGLREDSARDGGGDGAAGNVAACCRTLRAAASLAWCRGFAVAGAAPSPSPLVSSMTGSAAMAAATSAARVRASSMLSASCAATAAAAALLSVIICRALKRRDYGVPGETYNMGSDNEIANVDVARALLQMLGLLPGAGASAPAPAPLPAAACAAAARTSATAPASFPPAPATLTLSERRFIRLVKDRPFNDARYPLDCGKLFALGWRERVSWADGLRRTVEWYLGHPRYWPRASDMEQALVA